MIVHNINILMYIYRNKGSWSHLTYKRWRKNKCKVRVMVQMRRGTLGDSFVPPQLLLVTIFSDMVRLSACSDLGLHVRLI